MQFGARTHTGAGLAPSAESWIIGSLSAYGVADRNPWALGVRDDLNKINWLYQSSS